MEVLLEVLGVREWIILEINKWISSFREITKEKIIKRFPPEFIPFFRDGNDERMLMKPK